MLLSICITTIFITITICVSATIVKLKRPKIINEIIEKTDERCYNGGNKHNFISKYEEQDSVLGKMGRYDMHVPGIEKLSKYKLTYCTWCGKTINKKETENINKKSKPIPLKSKLRKESEQPEKTNPWNTLCEKEKELYNKKIK